MTVPGSTLETTTDSQPREPGPPRRTEFAQALLEWFAEHGRHDLPWQHPRTPYRVWVSEIMLQQTQVQTVIPYFERFVARFPDVSALASASMDEVLALWSGLGYYARARNLKHAAEFVLEHHDGKIPDQLAALMRLPGIGRSTAAAIASLAFDQPEPILDGNVRRVLARRLGMAEWPGSAQASKRLWECAAQLQPPDSAAAYSQAIMDLGALVCTRRQPACQTCPVQRGCVAAVRGQTDKIPAPRPRKARPERSVCVLIEPRSDGVILEQRPSQGVWGGLYSLPEAQECDPAWPRAAPIRHDFTHFRLALTPVLARPGATVQDRPTICAGPSQLAGLGLPRPVERLLRDYFAGNIQWQEPSTA